MQVFSDPKSWLKWRGEKRSQMTIGNFDGVHLGHRQLLTMITGGELSVLLSFYPHPIQVLRPEKKHTRLFNLQDQQEQLGRCGLNAILRQPFSREFSELSAEDFLQNYILKYFHPSQIVVGHDFSFGAYRKGNRETLALFCAQNKIDLHVVSPLRNSQDQVISTSTIREALLGGNLALAEEMLGRKYYLQGVVEKGEQRGRMLGFPTANIRPDVDFYPRMGVYVCQVSAKIFGQEKKLSVMNIGVNRTFVEGDHHPIKAEVHILDFADDIYGQTLRVEFCQYLRPEKKFDSLGELKDQIGSDILKAKELFR